ncbi:MAG: hypothetical protein ACR2KG_00325 [Nocardioidaceae bacterium]
MRSNGLTAASYTPVADLHPRLADALLDELRDRGIAAYAKPAETASTTGFERPEFRIDVVDRLYVDAAASAQARQLVLQQDPLLIETNDDLIWAQIVAGFDQPVFDDVPRWPVNEDLDWATPAEPSPQTPPDDESFAAISRGQAADEDGERFVPEPPPPLPKLPGSKQLAWLGLVGGPMLLLVSAFFSIALPSWLALIAAGGFIGGFITLVATMKDRSDDDFGSDDGAVV